MRVHAALVNAFTVCQAECQPLLILVSLGCFFTLIHISDSRRGALKSAACHGWSSCPRSWGVTLLGFTGFHFCFSLHSGLGTHPSWPLCLLSSIHHVVIHRVRREGWGWGSSLLLYPLPSHVPAVTVSALWSSTSPAGRWACCDGPLSRQHSGQECSGTAPVQVTTGTGEEQGWPPWSKRVLSSWWGQNWYQYLQKLGEEESKYRMWEKLRGRDNLQD